MESNLVQNLVNLKSLPETWAVKDFKEVVSDNSGGNKKLAKSNFLKDGDIAVVDQGKKLIAGFYNDTSLAVKTQPPYVVFGDHTRAFKYVDFPFIMGADGTKVLQPKKDNCETKYLYYFFLSINVPNTGYNRHFKYLKNLKIPLPQLDKQKKIAAILDAADAYRQKTKALIFKYDELTQSLFLNMFGDPFKGDVSPLKNNISIVGGYAFKSNDFIKEGLPLIKIGTVNKGYFEIDNFSFLPKSYLSKYLKWNVKSGDILMSLTGTVGKDDYGNVEKATDHYENYLLNQRVAKLEPSNDVYLKDFLFGMFSNNKTKKELTKISRGVRQANISNRDIENLKMITPSVENQKLYISAVASIEAQKAQAQASLAQAEDLFNSLLQRAFKGELTS